ncbi:Do family serine endopeptidase [Roseovarius salinarum]|uniref:Do family serine endopeptidase n=1 Tax=Roseovarius salinarum TaxID=1981892 RepID=UPI000C32D161|nr:Do family serine endopeptidase [Roseovarius salinarum]
MIRALCILLLGFAGPAAAEMQVPQDRAEIRKGFTPVVERAAPAVVNIYAKRIVNVRVSPFRNDPFFQDLFRDFGTPRKRVQNSLGSGVILSQDGLLVSNYHVVGQATDIRVVLNDRREFSAEVVLADEESDLAVLRLDGAQGMPALELRDSDTVQVGELVLAIGNPFGVGQTVSSGIVSGLARSGTATGDARGYFIQTDAPINPGNSGGALVDVNGRLIGVNTAILSRSGGSNGIGFAIPSALVAQFLDQARAGNDSFRRPWAGLNGQPVTADMAEGLGLSRPGGMVVSQVHPASAFAAAGFRAGDVITAVDGEPVNTPAEMSFRMTVSGIGASATVTRVRDGTTEKVSVDLIAPPNDPPRAKMETGRNAVIPGMTISTVNPKIIADRDLSLNARGVLVDDPGPVGRRAGLRPGDIVLSVNGTSVEDTEALSRLLQRVEGRLALEIRRGDRRAVMRYRL